jgi:hypothetical protein
MQSVSKKIAIDTSSTAHFRVRLHAREKTKGGDAPLSSHELYRDRVEPWGAGVNMVGRLLIGWVGVDQ